MLFLLTLSTGVGGHSKAFIVVFDDHKSVFYGFRKVYVVTYEQTTKRQRNRAPPCEGGHSR